MNQIIDLSVPVNNNAGEPLPIKVKRTEHRKGADEFGRGLIWSSRKTLGQNIRSLLDYIKGDRRLSYKSFPDEEFISLEVITINSHAGTHMDAPSHFGTHFKGQKSRTIDELPIEWFYGDGVLLDLTQKKGGEFITSEDIKHCLEKIHYQIKERDIVLLYTGQDKKWGTKEYFSEAPGMSAEAAKYLIDLGVKVMGIDSYGFDRPFPYMLGDYFRTHDNKYLWPAHVLGRTEEYVHMERMCNLGQIPIPYGFKVCCMPIKLQGMDAAWVRAVAII